MAPRSSKPKSSKMFMVFGALGLYLLSTGVSYAIVSNTMGSSDEIVAPVTLSEDQADERRGRIDPGEPRTEACPLNGQMYTKTEKEIWTPRRPLGVMIENHVEARPQSGLSSADVVYEAVAEGGITRYLALFYCGASAEDVMIGPIRSARTYFVDWISEYGEYPLYVHVGGANCNAQTGSGCINGAKADALGQIRKYGWENYNDLNQFSIPFQYMWRDYDRLKGVATEHTMYSTTDKLWEYASDKRKIAYADAEGNGWDADFVPYSFKDDAPEPERGQASPSFLFWEGYKQFTADWQYNSLENSYARSTGGQPHTDKNNDQQLTAKTVVVAFMDESRANDGYEGNLHLLYGNKGTGDAIIFQDGQAITGKWSKKTRTDRTIFTDAKGEEIEFNRGQLWIEIVPTGQDVDY